MANLTRTTKDHEEIRRWAEERGGKPSHVKRTGSGDDIGILRIDFPGYSGADTLEEISWDQWFDKFDERNLGLLYQEETAGGERSNFNKIVSAETAKEAQAGGKKAAKKKASVKSKKGAVKKAAKKAPARKKAAKAVTKRPAAKKTATKKTASKGAKKAARGGSKRTTKKSATKKRR
jgi:hypothetical protein